MMPRVADEVLMRDDAYVDTYPLMYGMYVRTPDDLSIEKHRSAEKK
jgi:hypothetical protein